VAPAAAVFGVGAYNTEGRPDRETVGRLAAAGVRVYRTDREGTVRVMFGTDSELEIRMVGER
jgi:competence protein ComEC